MEKIDWKRKLTSRKFWVAVVGLVSGIILAFNGGEQLAQTVSGVIMAAASVIAYAVGEGLADNAAASGDTYIVQGGETPAEEPAEEPEEPCEEGDCYEAPEPEDEDCR